MIHGEGNGTPLQYSCLEKSHGRSSLEGCNPWGRWGSDTTERLHFHFSLSRIGEGNGNPLQCSCLENPRDGGAWWAAVYGVTQSRTQLKWLSSSSSKESDTTEWLNWTELCDQWYWDSFHVPFGLSCIFFGKMSVKILCPFLNWIICHFIIEL